MQAVILAGGKGTRLRPYTTEVPKPLVPVASRPIIEILLRCMRKHGVKQVHIAVNHLAHLIMAVLGDGREIGMEINYSLEDRPLSTVGPLKLIDGLDDNFLVANGDIVTDLDFGKLFQRHLKSGARLTVATHRRVSKIDYGVLKTSASGSVTTFEEKPEYEFNVSMGVYVFSRTILELVPRGEPFGFDELMLKLLENKEPVGAFEFDGYWLDIGRPDDYEQAKKDVEKIHALLE